MTVINPNSISGVASVTAQGDIIQFYKSDGTLGAVQFLSLIHISEPTRPY